MRKQVRSIMCGCGNCQLRPNAAVECPMASSKTAIQLWHSSREPEGQEQDTSTIDLMEELVEEAEVEEVPF